MKWMLVNGSNRGSLIRVGLILVAFLLAACSQMSEPLQLESVGEPMVAFAEPDLSLDTPEAAQLTEPLGIPLDPPRDAPLAVVPEIEFTPLSDAALIAMGEKIYATNCAPCHQPNGEGNLSIFPALNRNPFVTVSTPTAVIDTVLHGRQVMPAFEPTLSAQEVAAVISYIRNAWSNEASVVSAAQVREVQEEDRSQ